MAVGLNWLSILQLHSLNKLPPSRVPPKQRAAVVGRFNSPHKDPSVSYWLSSLCKGLEPCKVGNHTHITCTCMCMCCCTVLGKMFLYYSLIVLPATSLAGCSSIAWSSVVSAQTHQGLGMRLLSLQGLGPDPNQSPVGLGLGRDLVPLLKLRHW